MCFIVKYLGRDSNIPVCKGVDVCLERCGKLPYPGVLLSMICSMSKNDPINKQKYNLKKKRTGLKDGTVNERKSVAKRLRKQIKDTYEASSGHSLNDIPLRKLLFENTLVNLDIV